MSHLHHQHGQDNTQPFAPNDFGGFGGGRGDHAFNFFDIFKQAGGGMMPQVPGHHLRSHPGHHGGGDTAPNHLPHLSIGGLGAQPHHHGKHPFGPGEAPAPHHHTKHPALDGEPPLPHNKKGHAHPGRTSDNAGPGREALDTGVGSWAPGGSSSDAIAAAAARSVGHQTYLPRPGSAYYGQHLPASLGCTSASTNMFFDGLKAAGKVSDKDYHKINQVGNDTAYVNMQHLGIARPVNGHDLKPGDWAYFKNPGAKHGHSGVVFEGKNGQLMLANNHSGRTIETPISSMRARYSTVRALRANI